MTAESVFSTSLRHCGTPCFWRKYARSNGGGDWCFAGVGVGGSDAGSGGAAAAGPFADAEQDAGGVCLWRVLVRRAAGRRWRAATHDGRPSRRAGVSYGRHVACVGRTVRQYGGVLEEDAPHV